MNHFKIMYSSIIPCCQFPTTVIFIDDNKEFLKSANLCLPEGNVSYRFFSNPIQALAFLKNDYQQDPLTNRFLTSPLPQKDGGQTLDFNIQNLYHEVYNPKRFEQISAVVVDYDMPEMDGISFAQQINHLDVTKILLTAAADEHLAVKAFNEGAINQFLQKQQENIFQALDKIITESQLTYFQKLSSIFQNSILKKQDVITAIDDPSFLRLVEFTIEKYNIVEFYQTETIGSLLMLDEDGQYYTLQIQTTDQIEANYLEIVEEDNSLYSPELKEEIRTGKKLFCLPVSNHPCPSEWKQYLHVGTELSGKEKYFYTLSQTNPSLDTSKVLAFKDYKLKSLMEVGADCFV